MSDDRDEEAALDNAQRTPFHDYEDGTLAARLRLAIMHPRAFSREEREDLVREAAFRLERGTLRERGAQRRDRIRDTEGIGRYDPQRKRDEE